MPAPEGNKNARREVAGLQINFYLTAEQKQAIAQQLGTDEGAAIREEAREWAKNGIALMLQGKCDVDGCMWAAQIACEIGSCAPLTRYCSYHYDQTHLAEDERDEVDQITGKSYK